MKSGELIALSTCMYSENVYFMGKIVGEKCRIFMKNRILRSLRAMLVNVIADAREM